MAFGKNKDAQKNDASSNLWTLEAGFNSPWRLTSTSNTHYVLKGRSAEQLGWLNMTLTIDRRDGTATCTAEWNSRKVKPAPDPVKLNARLVLRKGKQKKELHY